MEKSEIYKALESDFTSTFIYELMPGVLHNFANPLNGIMGRAKLLQRRIDDTLKKINEQYPETAAGLADELQRIKNDIHSVNKESESFFEMFRDASGKFYALASKGQDRINISQLLAAEMRFSNFYLEFKHEITKKVQLDGDGIDEIKGNTAELSLVFWRLIRFAMIRALKSEIKEFSLETQHDNENIFIIIKYSGDGVPKEVSNNITKCFQDNKLNMSDIKAEKGLLMAFAILKQYAAKVQFSVQEDINTLSVTMPYRVSAG